LTTKPKTEREKSLKLVSSGPVSPLRLGKRTAITLADSKVAHLKIIVVKISAVKARPLAKVRTVAVRPRLEAEVVFVIGERTGGRPLVRSFSLAPHHVSKHGIDEVRVSLGII